MKSHSVKNNFDRLNHIMSVFTFLFWILVRDHCCALLLGVNVTENMGQLGDFVNGPLRSNVPQLDGAL